MGKWELGHGERLLAMGLGRVGHATTFTVKNDFYYSYIFVLLSQESTFWETAPNPPSPGHLFTLGHAGAG